jgi:RHS repeat-associated protein
VFDGDGDGWEETPLDLSDNFASGAENNSLEFHNRLLFTGRRLDPATGLYYYRQRYLEPITGRFVSRDPLGYSESPNRYSYVGNSPIHWMDPMGLERVSMVFYNGELSWGSRLNFFLWGGYRFDHWSDIITQIAQRLREPFDKTGVCQDCLSRLEILDHAGGGVFTIGNVQINSTPTYGSISVDPGMAAFLITLKGYLCDESIIHINQCDSGVNKSGENLVRKVHELTGATVVAPKVEVAQEFDVTSFPEDKYTQFPPAPPPPPPPPVMIMGWAGV